MATTCSFTPSVAALRGSASASRPQAKAALVKCQAERSDAVSGVAKFVVGVGAFASLALSSPALAEMKLPPVDKDPKHCERAFVGNTIGQANAVSDKLLDLRECDLSGKNLVAKTLSGALMSSSNFSKANMQEAVFSKAYAIGSNFEGADFSNSILDRADFSGAKMAGAKFVNAVITGTQFQDADLTDADFEDALVSQEDIKRLCANPTLVGDSRFQLGCRTK